MFEFSEFDLQFIMKYLLYVYCISQFHFKNHKIKRFKKAHKRRNSPEEIL